VCRTRIKKRDEYPQWCFHYKARLAERHSNIQQLAIRWVQLCIVTHTWIIHLLHSDNFKQMLWNMRHTVWIFSCTSNFLRDKQKYAFSLSVPPHRGLKIKISTDIRFQMPLF
jgi:hypothetical protein